MNQAELQTLARAVGVSERAAPIASAIAIAESGGNPTRYNPETAAKGGTPRGQGSYGLWQIYLKAHPEFTGQNLYDPMTNARAMYSVSSGGLNWYPWTTYKTGAYRKYLTQGQAAAGQKTPASDGGQSTGLPGSDQTGVVPPSEEGLALPPALIIAALAVVAAFAFG